MTAWAVKWEGQIREEVSWTGNGLEHLSRIGSELIQTSPRCATMGSSSPSFIGPP